MKKLIFYLKLFREDSKRYGLKKSFFTRDPRLRAIFYLRMSQYFFFVKNNFFSRILYNKLRTKYGLDIHPQTKIGGGIKIVHLGGIVVHKDCIIGKNLTILNNVTLGQRNSREINSVPILGNNVSLSVFSTLIGRIKVGDNCIIGTHTVIYKDLEPNTKVHVKQDAIFSKIISKIED